MPLPKFGGEEYKFPDEVDENPTKKAEEEKFEVEIEDDTPEEDRGRKPLREPIEDPTDEELASYDEKVQQRIKKFTRGYHDERRAKEEALREREAAEAFARQVYEENRRLQQQLATGSKELIETSKSAAEAKLMAAKKKFKEAQEAGDFDAAADDMVEAVAGMRVERQRIAALEPDERQADPRCRVEQLHPLPVARAIVVKEIGRAHV